MDAFAAETLPHLAELRRAARKLAPVDGEDLVQETFLRAFAARSRYHLGTNARAWLYAILANAAHTARRRTLRDERLRARMASEPPGEQRDRAGERDDLLGALARLPPSQRRVIELADLDGLSYREVAARTGAPLGTVMSRLHRARLRLRAELDDQTSEIAAPQVRHAASVGSATFPRQRPQ